MNKELLTSKAKLQTCASSYYLGDCRNLFSFLFILIISWLTYLCRSFFCLSVEKGCGCILTTVLFQQIIHNNKYQSKYFCYRMKFSGATAKLLRALKVIDNNTEELYNNQNHYLQYKFIYNEE